MSHKLFRQKVETPEKEAQAPDPPRQTMIIYGNCQAEAIANILKKSRLVRSFFRVVCHRNFDPPGKTNPPVSPEELASCALFRSAHSRRVSVHRSAAERLRHGAFSFARFQSALALRLRESLQQAGSAAPAVGCFSVRRSDHFGVRREGHEGG